jgi:hypothetical protein
VSLTLVTGTAWFDSGDGAELSCRVPAGDGARRTLAVRIHRAVLVEAGGLIARVKLRDDATFEAAWSGGCAGLGRCGLNRFGDFIFVELTVAHRVVALSGTGDRNWHEYKYRQYQLRLEMVHMTSSFI